MYCDGIQKFFKDIVPQKEIIMDWRLLTTSYWSKEFIILCRLLLVVGDQIEISRTVHSHWQHTEVTSHFKMIIRGHYSDLNGL
jgi:hypothetical protein